MKNAAIVSLPKQLPIVSRKYDIIQTARENLTMIVIGETACGKTTQIPKYLLELQQSENRKGVIGCTQPRRIAAVTVAKRVSQEMRCELGSSVGYAVRFDNCTSKHTHLKYMSDGILIREAMVDPFLSQYSTIILDEVHERSVNTELLCSIVRHAQRKRRKRSIDHQLRIVLMSATINPNCFQCFFADKDQHNSSDGSLSIPPVLRLQGRLFEVEVYHAEYKGKIEDYDYEHASIVTLVKINREFPPDHGVLIFLTGQEEIECYVRYLRKLAPDFIKDCGIGLEISPMYANMSMDAQMRAMGTSKEGTRKVIVATNVAESSLTIAGIRIVIDSGRVKRKQYCAETGIESLKLQIISRTEALQRAGRAGRQSKGYCFRL